MTDLLELSADRPELVVRDAEVLIEEGTTRDRIYVLVSGEVVIEHDGVPFARVDTVGAVFGEMSAVLGRPATATVRASGDATLRVIDDPLEFLTDQPGAALSVLRTTASRLDGMTQYLVDVKRQFAGNEDHMAMIDRILDTLVHHQAPRPRTGSSRDPEGHDGH